MSRRRPRSGSVERLASRRIAELSLATLASARRLFNDAKLLYEAERLPSAFVLLGLCADELGKHVMVTAFCAAREDTDAEWEKFWARFRLHEAKLDVALFGAWLEDVLDLADPPSGRDLHKRRLGATYVDLDPTDRSIVTPEAVVTSEMARRTLVQVGRYLEYCEVTMVHADVDRLTEVFDTVRKGSKPEGDQKLVLAHTMAARYGLSAADALRITETARHLSTGAAAAPASGSDLFAKIATAVLGTDVTPAEASRMLEIVEQEKSERDDAWLGF